MKKSLLNMLFILILLIGAVVFLNSKQSSAAGSKFDGVMPFITISGQIGFFNQNDGKVYLYDGDYRECILVTQMDELGKPMAPTLIEKKY